MNFNLLIIFAVLIMILLNIIIYKIILTRALKRHIVSDLSKYDLKVAKTKFAGFFSSGDFKSDGFGIRFVMKNGNIINSTYVYLFLTKKGGGDLKRITVKINTAFLMLTDVEYSTNIARLG